MSASLIIIAALGGLTLIAALFSRTLMMIFLTASAFYYIGFTHGYGTGHRDGISFRDSAAAIQREFSPLTDQVRQQFKKELKR